MHKSIQNIAIMLVLFTNSFYLFSQYTGGETDGFNYALFEYACPPPNLLSMYKGGRGNELFVDKHIQSRCQTMFIGGSNDGSSAITKKIAGCNDALYTDMYKGNRGGGFGNAFNIQSVCQSMFTGGSNDGSYAITKKIEGCGDALYTDMYKGNRGGGFGNAFNIQSVCQSFFTGGHYDGAIVSRTALFVCPEARFIDLYRGGQSDGFSTSKFIQSSCQSFFSGGYYDGHNVGLLFQSCPDLDITASEDSICIGEGVGFTPEYSVHNYTKFQWFFEGGVPDTSSSKYPSITYPNAGLYDVMLIASNDSVIDTLRKTDFILVGAKTAEPIIASGPTTFCECGFVTLTAPAGRTYTWSTGQTSQSITAFESGAYKVTVDGCYIPADSINVVLMDNNINPTISTNGFDYNTIVLKTTPSISYVWSPNGETVDSIIVSSSGTYYVETLDLNGCPKRSSKAKVKISGVCNEAALGINLNYFSGLAVNNELVLTKWETFYEDNNNYFTLERTKDYETWTTIAIIKGNGTTKTKSYYQYYDKEPLFGTSYYRLKQTDYDGETEYIGYIAINIYPKSIRIRNIFPNPVEDNITYLISSDNDSMNLNIEVHDILGKSLINKEENIRQGDNHNKLNVSNIDNGCYFLTFSVVENKTQGIRKRLLTWKFIKH